MTTTLYSCITGTASFDFYEIINSRKISIYLEEIRDILYHDIDKGYEEPSKDPTLRHFRLSTREFYNCLNFGQLDCVHSMFVDKQYITEHSTEAEILRKERKNFIVQKFFKQTMKTSSLLIKGKPGTLKEQVKKHFDECVLGYYLSQIALDCMENKDINPKNIIEDVMDLDHVKQKVRSNIKQIKGLYKEFPEKVDPIEIFTILRSRHVEDYGK